MEYIRNQNEDYDKQTLELMENEDIKNLINNLQKVEKEFENILQKYSKGFSESDKKQQDILHYIEFKSLSSVGAYKLSKELQNVRKERRKIEDIVTLLNDISNSFKFNGKNKISDIIKKREQTMKKRKYIPRCYEVSTLDNISTIRRHAIEN